MDREEALGLIKEKVSNKNLKKHMLATEACMKEIAELLGKDKELWAIAGLLHDLDYDTTKDNFPRHGFETVEMLEDKGLSEEILQAILSHTGNVERTSVMDKALYAIDPTTGLIVAAALMHPSKKLENLDVDFIMRRFKEKRFAAGADREQIKTCSELDFELEEFIGICLKGMRSISDELGL
ncbi:MAG: HD domain-containing protein [Candidatus Cloacimonadota bacterium]|nr:MAG: HD domain-containing protein [Candidatus Cloacimonadota bacterium]